MYAKDSSTYIGVDERSSHLTTFETPFGSCRWTRLSFGIAPAPEIFQTKIHETLSNLPGVYTAADDILIAGEGSTNIEEAERHHYTKLKTPSIAVEKED